jgi:phage head maturation protease
MKTLLKISEMMPYLPAALKDAIHHVAKETSNKTDALELHRHSHSEKAAVNGLDPKSRRALKYVSYRTQDRDDEIVIPETISLTEFKKYGHVLVNHNYSLLPVGSDVDISADDYGIKALTEYADTGAGTLANVVWALVSQGHLKSSSIGFVPTSYTKPGSRDWDHVANQLQSNWKEFDKSRAEKSISRIITGGVLLEHSDVSVPCNADAELISVCKGMNLDGRIIKQLGWEMKDGILVNKQEADPVPCVCDECGYVADAVVGSRCPECKTGTMKAKGKEKAIEIHGTEEKTHEVVFTEQELHFALDNKGRLPTPDELKSYHYGAVEKPNPHMPGGSFSACVLIMEDKGRDTESAKKICGALQADAGGKGLTEAETKAVKEAKAYYTPCVCDECGAEADTNPGEPCEEDGCKGTMQAKKEKEKAVPSIKLIRPAPSVKILFAPPTGDMIASQVGEAVERALSRRTGKIM